MSEKPIIFSAEMVRAILEDRKTQTRRVMVAQPRWEDLTHRWLKWVGTRRDNDLLSWRNGDQLPYKLMQDCPYGQPGDHLWVRETWCEITKGVVAYRANGLGPQDDLTWRVEKWCPSIFMPRWASRLTLQITNVRVQRVQDISEEDAKAEGVLPISWLGNTRLDNYRTPFAHLWDSLNVKRGGWDTNLWVWAISFRRQM